MKVELLQGASSVVILFGSVDSMFVNTCAPLARIRIPLSSLHLWDSQSVVLCTSFLSEALLDLEAVWTFESLARAVGESKVYPIWFYLLKVKLTQVQLLCRVQKFLEGGELRSTLQMQNLQYLVQRSKVCQLKIPFYLSLPLD